MASLLSIFIISSSLYVYFTATAIEEAKSKLTAIGFLKSLPVVANERKLVHIPMHKNTEILGPTHFEHRHIPFTLTFTISIIIPSLLPFHHQLIISLILCSNIRHTVARLPGIQIVMFQNRGVFFFFFCQFVYAFVCVVCVCDKKRQEIA